MDNYLDNVEAYCNKNKMRDLLNGEEMNPDEKLMRSIEEQIGISENAKKAFEKKFLFGFLPMQEKENVLTTILMNVYEKPLKRNYLQI